MSNSNQPADSIDTCNSISRLSGIIISPKYGDGDVSSKRRKSLDLSDERVEENLIELEYTDYEQFASESCVNSSFLEHLDQNLDFKGGLLLGNKRRKLQTKSASASTATSSRSSASKLSAKNTLIVTTKPSPTSKGFENTFKLLQNQILNKNQRRSILSESTERESPTRLDLELEARQRLYILHESNKDNRQHSIVAASSLHENCTCCSKRQLINFLHDFTTKSVPNTKSLDPRTSQASHSHHKEDELIATEIQSEPDGLNLLYHATKCADGTKRLRVLRNTAVSKSKVLCGNRVSQMTRAYDDIEAVTRLLEEKEKDLELTVQIGKELLTQNNSLENRITELEADLKESNDDRAQLVHELNKKNELIAVLTNDADDGSEAETPTFSKSVTLDLLQRKVNSLQDENKSLKMEASQLAKQTDDVEAHERQLMEDISSQMSEANTQFESLSLELERQREENRLQHEQIVSLTARLAEAEMRLHQLTHDNDEHVTLLSITKQNQNSLALELVEFKQRYQEVLELLQETQEQLRKQRKRAMPQARSGSFMSGVGASGMSGSGYGFLQPDSLQSELIESTFSENSLDSGISTDRDRANDRIGRLMSQLASNSCGNSGGAIKVSALGGASLGVNDETGIANTVPSYQRVFDTVRCASKSGNYADSSGVNSLTMSQLGAMSMSSSSGPRMSAVAVPAGSYYRNDSFYDSYNAMGDGGKTLSCESLISQTDENYPTQPEGVPGAPGAKDLEAALKRLTPAEVLARRAMLSYAPAGTYNYDEQQQHNNHKYQKQSSTLPLGVRTPDSIMSTGSSGISSTVHMSSSMHQWRLPAKLQIIKPMEGSQTLHHWSQLATPTLSGLLEKRPGVTIRGGRDLDDLGMQVYTLEDVEEDFSEDLPGKQFEAPGCTYTFTNSMVMHPDDGIVNDLSFLSQSQMSSRMASTSTSRQPSCPPTPRSGLSRKNSCSTFSVNLGLASMLNERGIKAVTPSALNTPAGPNFSPTVTPCNSPEGSPTRSRSPEPLFGLFTSGADLIRRKLLGGDMERPTRNQQKQQQQKILLSRLERRALRSLRLVEKVESIGLENIISSQPCPMSQLASGIANRSSSPMAQLTSLRSLHTSSNSIVDDIHFERDQIKDVLHKGLNKTSKSSNSRSDSSSAYTSDNDGTLSDSSDNSFRNDYRTPTSSPRQQVDLERNKDSSLTLTAQNIDMQSQSTTAPKTTSAAYISSVTLPSQSETRIKQMQRQKSRRNIKNGMAAQRPDLGRVRNDLGKVEKPSITAKTTNQEASKISSLSSDKDGGGATQSLTQSFVGTVSSLLFGRKGGWL